MISQAKVDANRKNARKSTGPRTATGKAIASINAVKHGLSARMPVIPEENEVEFEDYTARWLGELKPAGPMQEFLAERIISIAWRLRRIGRIEASLFKPSESQETHQLSRLNRYEVALERSFYRNSRSSGRCRPNKRATIRRRKRMRSGEYKTNPPSCKSRRMCYLTNLGRTPKGGL